MTAIGMGHSGMALRSQPPCTQNASFMRPRIAAPLKACRYSRPSVRITHSTSCIGKRILCRAETVDAEAQEPTANKEVIEDDIVEEGEGEEQAELDEEQELTEDEFLFLLDQPEPSNLQQTLYKSFVLESNCQHGGHSACIKIKPAYAGEGRYFVVVPHGSIPPPEEMPAAAEEKLQQLQEAQEAEAEGRAPPGGRAARDLEEDLTVEMPPDELTSRGESDQVIVPSLDSASIIPEGAMFLTLQNGDNRIINAETLLAALEAVGVDNARIEIEEKEDGSKPLEIPCPDGSATVISDMVKFSGIRYAPSKDGTEHVPKQRIIPRKIISVREGNSFIQLIPGSQRRVSVGIDHTEEAPVIGSQWATWAPTDGLTQHWRWHIAPARPYIVSPQIGQAMQAEGYYQGAGDQTVLVANYEEYNDEESVRFDDEPARRKVLEFVADLSLLSQQGGGGIPEGHIIAFQPSRDLQLKFLRAVLRNSDFEAESSEPPKDVEAEEGEQTEQES